MNSLIESLTGMDKMSDQVIATDFLISAKTAVRNYSVAITENISSEVRTVLREQIRDAIVTHDAITNYMVKRGYYYAYNLEEQYKVDMKVTNTALNLNEGIF